MAIRRGEHVQRQRVHRSEARGRITAAAAELLEERPWPDIALDEVMGRAELSRTIFYRHFEDRQALLLALLEESGAAEDQSGEIWKLAGGEPLPELRQALAALTDLFVEHGRLLQAVADAAVQDDDIRELWLAMADGFVTTTVDRIDADVAGGRSQVTDAREVARALVWMNERYLLACFGHRPFTAEPAAATAALTRIWAATIYGAQVD